MLTHFRFRNKYGVLVYFIDNEKRADLLSSNGFAVEYGEYSVSRAKVGHWLPFITRKKVPGRRSSITDENLRVIDEFNRSGVSITDIAKRMNISWAQARHALNVTLKRKI